MNIEHLRAILWLRWKMSSNQWRKLGMVNAVVTSAIVVIALIGSVGLFFATLVGGSLFMLHDLPEPDKMMYAWDIIVCLFLFVWLIGLVTELQRSELLSLDRMLHLPLSLSGAFVLNYATSLLSLPMMIFLPGMLGLSLACIIAYGPAMLPILFLLASFMLFVTALTYQFRGWLATLMENKRRRKSIIVAVTLVFMIVVQAPQFINIMFMNGSSRGRNEAAQQFNEDSEELREQLTDRKISSDEFKQRIELLKRERDQSRERSKAEFYNNITEYTILANKYLPIGWLPYGVRASAMGSPWPGLIGSLALCGLGALSLWRSYNTTIRFYTGVRSAPKKRKAKSSVPTTRKLSNSAELKLPLLSEQVSAVTAVSFRSMLRAPESKMALVMPVIFFCIFGGMIIVGPAREIDWNNFDWVPSYIAIAIIGVIQFGLAQLMINVFGMDRNGFRAFVLMPVPRRDILVGKNLSLAPFLVLLTVIMVIAAHVVLGIRITHILATFIQLVPTFLLFSLAGNTASILAPMAIASGSLKPVQQNFSTVLLQMFFMMFSPLCLLPAVAALSFEVGLEYLLDLRGWPIYLTLSVVEAALSIWIYRSVVTVQGKWLQAREPRMLEKLTDVPE